MKNILILQHIKIEDPGYIKDLMIEDKFDLTTIELDEGEKIPKDLSKFDGMPSNFDKSFGIFSPSSSSIVVRSNLSSIIKSFI